MTAVHVPRAPRHTLVALASTAGLIAALAACGAPEPSASAPPQPAAAGDVPDAFGVRPGDPARTAAMLARARDLVRPGSVVQTESRLGVPTFLWARPPARALAAGARRLTVGADRPELTAARAALASYAPLYGLSDADVAGAVVSHVHDLGTGPVLVKYRAELGGIEIFREELGVVLGRDLEPIALSGYLSGAATPPSRGGALAFTLAAPLGAAEALAHLAHAPVDPSALVAAGSRDGYDHFTLAAGAGITLDDPIRIKRVYYHLPEGLEAAYYIEIAARTGTAPVGTLSADGAPLATPEAYAYVVSAVTGQLLFRKNLVADAVGRGPRAAALADGGFTYRVWADPVTGIPLDTPAGNAIDPKVDPVPDGVQYSFVGTTDITLPNFPFSRNDPWLPAGATETTGNNVEAFLNLFSPDGFGPSAPPTDPASGDFHAQITAAGQFLHSQLPDDFGAHGPWRAEGRQGAIQQLFYNINFLHDWYYDSGFTEAAGNAQTDNFGRGGLGNDSIKGQAQDFSGFSNANMQTPADGGRPRMRMYVFPSPANHLELQAPAAIAGNALIGISMSGPQSYDLTTDIVRATFTAGPTTCTVTNAAALDGKIAMFDFDNTDLTGCSFSTRILRLTQTTNAVAILMVFQQAAPTVVANITGFVATNTKPVATISFNTGALIKAQLALPAPVTARLFRAPDRDGAIDQQIVFHEFFHYVSNRLVGNGAGLGTNMASGMGEGWSDFSSMLLTVRPDDAQVPSNATFNGVYSLASYATSGVPFDGSANQGYYFGIRRYPYSTDMTKNPLTFKHITNGVALPVGPPLGFGADGASNAEVHNTGEVWTTMLWECYAALLRDTLGPAPRLSFQQAQDRMKAYIIGGLKVTPTFPTVTEARDAILSVALATDVADYVAFRIAFAKRGAGAHAVSPDRLSTDNAGVIEDFGAGPELAFAGATLDDSLGSCDHDGALDRGEYGRLTVTLRNTGTTALSATTAALSTASADAWFPDGATLMFPAMAPGATGAASLRVAYSRNVTGIQQLDFKVDFTDAQLTAPLSTTVGFRTNTDEIAAASATDTVESATPLWTSSFGASLANAAPWHRAELTPFEHAFHVDDAGAGTDEYLVSPVLTVDASGTLGLAFDHSWSFEFDPTGNFDGGVIELSVNGGAFADLGTAAYTGTITSYAGDINPLAGRRGFVQSSNGTVHTALTRAVAPGSHVQIRFRAASDVGIGAAGWTVDNLAFTGVVETPFASVVPEADDCTQTPGSADLAITVDDGVTSVVAGSAVTYAIAASNAAGDDLPGAMVSDAFPAEAVCTWTCTATPGASCAAGGAGDIHDRIHLPAGGVATYLATCTVSAATASTQLTNTATISGPAQVADPVTANNAAADTDRILRVPAHLVASKTVAGSFVPGGAVTYTIALTNDSAGKQFNNPGDELTDVLPAGLTLVSAAASAGTAVASLATNTVTWNGELAAGATVTITIVATINAPAGATIANQATFTFDSDGDAANDATGTTDAFPCPR